MIKSPVFCRVFVLLEFGREKRTNFLKAQITCRFAMSWLEEEHVLVVANMAIGLRRVNAVQDTYTYIH